MSVLLDSDNGLANLLANLKDGSVTGSEQVNGVATTKITGNSAADDIATLAGSNTTVTLTMSDWGKKVAATKPA